MSSLALYEQMAMISADMARAAETQDWDRLARLEREVANLRDALTTRDVPPRALSADERSRKAALIHRILDNDAAVRGVTEPWMASVGRMLGAGPGFAARA